MILPLVDGNGQTQLVVIDRSTQLAREVLTSYFENGTVPVLAPPALIEPVIEAPLVPEPVIVPEPIPVVAPVAPVVVPAPIPVVAPVPIMAEALDSEKPVEHKHHHAHHKNKVGHVLKSAANSLHKAEEKAGKIIVGASKEIEKEVKKAGEAVSEQAKKVQDQLKQKQQQKLEALAATENKLPSEELTNEVLLGLDKIKANSVNLAAQLKNTIELHAHDVAQPMLEGLFDIAKTSAKIASHMKGLKATKLNEESAIERKAKAALMLNQLDMEQLIELLEDDLVTDEDLEALEEADSYLMEEFDQDLNSLFVY